MTIGYPDLAALPPELRDAVIKHGSPNVYRMIVHSPGLASGFLALAGAVLQSNSLPAHWRELAILRVGHAYEAEYEVHHHENLARWAGLSEAAMAAAGTGATDSLPEHEAAILRWTDLLLADHALGQEVLELLTVTQLADLIITVGYYQLVCDFLNIFHVTTGGEGQPA